jgi:hypothetical protein
MAELLRKTTNRVRHILVADIVKLHPERFDYLSLGFKLVRLSLVNSRNNPLSQNSVALVCQRSTSTERPPLVGEVSANFLRI